MNIFRRIRRSITRLELFWNWCGHPFGEEPPNPSNAIREHLDRITAESNPTPPTVAGSAHIEESPQSEERQSTPPPSAPAVGPWGRFWRYLGKVVATLFGVGSTCLFLLGLWDSYRPKITITPGGTLNQKTPFATFFIIQNQGALSISKINYRSQLTLVPMAGTPGPGIISPEQNVSVISELKPLETYSLSIHYGIIQFNTMPGVTNLQTAISAITNHIAGTNQLIAGRMIPGGMMLEFDVSYSPKFYGNRTDKLCFFAVPDADANWQWLPSGHEKVTDQTIDTNLIAQAQKMPPVTMISTMGTTNDSTQVHTKSVKPGLKWCKGLTLPYYWADSTGGTISWRVSSAPA